MLGSWPPLTLTVMACPSLSCSRGGGGIRVVMITGDCLETAIAIDVDCSRLRPSGSFLPNDHMDVLTAAVRVFARAKPEDELEIVK